MDSRSGEEGATRRLSTQRRAMLEEERWELLNGYGDGPWLDGLRTQRIARIDAQLASDGQGGPA